jgi:cytoskeletal protein CcmA (bactofilin family)
MQTAGASVIREDMRITGDIRRCSRLDVFGTIDGRVSAGVLVVHRGGRVIGEVTADSAEIDGLLKGRVAVRQLISIGSNGVVTGNVRYGRLALAAGGDLSADMRNVPPELGGDFSIVVRRGRTVRVTTSDLSTVDPDSAETALIYSISNARHGCLVMAGAPTVAVSRFSQADIAAGNVMFLHDGSGGAAAGFDVVVVDEAGATSGAPRTVTAAVVAA